MFLIVISIYKIIYNSHLTYVPTKVYTWYNSLYFITFHTVAVCGIYVGKNFLLPNKRIYPCSNKNYSCPSCCLSVSSSLLFTVTLATASRTGRQSLLISLLKGTNQSSAFLYSISNIFLSITSGHTPLCVSAMFTGERTIQFSFSFIIKCFFPITIGSRLYFLIFPSAYSDVIYCTVAGCVALYSDSSQFRPL